MNKLIMFLQKWNYRLHCLFDRYYNGEHITTQSRMYRYTGFWDRVGRQARSPYMHKSYSRLENILQKYRK